ncbi:MAG TPA: hypothetical protein VL442_16785 [Mucilaginibacter sp.]|nr:hypothetical protein [Mucilaginibacter sp.]
MYKLAKHIFIIFLFLGICTTSFGQVVRPLLRRPQNFQERVIQRPQNRGVNRIEAVREEYIDKRLSMSADQGQRFWPVYRRYRASLKQILTARRRNNSADQPNGIDQVNKELYYESELVNTRKYYTDEFLKILPPEKVSLIFKSERDFNDELIKQLSERSEAIKTNP